MSYAENTVVTPERSRGEIERILTPPATLPGLPAPKGTPRITARVVDQ
jgi:hypothetical protein